MLDHARQRFSLAFKRRVVGFWLGIEKHLPIPIRALVWNGVSLFGKPRLGYLETHLVDHCNMNCRGCMHFSSLASPWFADPVAFACEMRRLGELFSRIRTIRLMGGEPLLHPAVEAFLPITRASFPRARISLVTNGLLLSRMPPSFWLACREHRVTIDLTLYPPLQRSAAALRALCRGHRVTLRESVNDLFCVRMNYRGDSPADKAFSACRNLFYCPLLRGGRLYGCAPAAFVGDLNARFGMAIPCAAGISIFDPSVTGRRIIRYLNRPVATCRFCATAAAEIPWANGPAERADWDVAHAMSGRGEADHARQ